MMITAGDIFFYATNNRVNTEGIIKDSMITLSQLRHIKPILTEDLYDAYISSPSTYADLDTYLKPCLAYFCLLDNFDVVHMKITDSGVYKVGARNGTTTVTDNEREMVKVSIREDAREWGGLLTEYLNDNYEDNDLFDKSNSIYNSMTFKGGLVF